MRFSNLMKFGLFMLFALIFLASCKSETPKNLSVKTGVQPAFYHWQSNLEMDEPTYQNLQKLGVKKMYLKFFDIDRVSETADAGAHAILVAKGDFYQKFELIPTIFITNRTFLNSTDNYVERLAFIAANKIKAILKEQNLQNPNEIQLDCDWTESTREKYFHFIERFEKHYALPIKLSSTIRLHQIKFHEETGTPPVEKGMLMFYNMGNLDNWETKNSILDLDEAKKYMARLPEYPLPLDVVFPTYSWGVLYRDFEMIRLFPGLYPNDFKLFEKIADNRFKLPESGYFKGDFLYANDRFRLEDVHPDSLLKAAQMVHEYLKNPIPTVGFYHLHEHSFEKYPINSYQKVLDIFGD